MGRHAQKGVPAHGAGTDTAVDPPDRRRIAPDDEVLGPTRLLAAVIVPFLVVAFVLLYLFPAETDDHFAWTIEPTMTAMVLGAVYLGGAWFFVSVIRARAWHTVRAGFPAVAVFAGLLGVATILHWDRFHPSHVSFVTWATLYFTTPFLVVAAFVWNDRLRWRATGGGTGRAVHDATARLPPAPTLAIGAVGAALTVTGLLMFLFPDGAIDVWPWTLTPLTARVMGSCFTLGLAGVVLALDARLDAVRLTLEVAAIMFVLIAVAGVRAGDEIDTGEPLAWLLGIALALILVGGAAVWARYLRPAAGVS
jgi:hypothetical protein